MCGICWSSILDNAMYVHYVHINVYVCVPIVYICTCVHCSVLHCNVDYIHSCLSPSSLSGFPPPFVKTWRRSRRSQKESTSQTPHPPLPSSGRATPPKTTSPYSPWTLPASIASSLTNHLQPWSEGRRMRCVSEWGRKGVRCRCEVCGGGVYTCVTEHSVQSAVCMCTKM